MRRRWLRSRDTPSRIGCLARNTRRSSRPTGRRSLGCWAMTRPKKDVRRVSPRDGRPRYVVFYAGMTLQRCAANTALLFAVSFRSLYPSGSRIGSSLRDVSREDHHIASRHQIDNASIFVQCARERRQGITGYSRRGSIYKIQNMEVAVADPKRGSITTPTKKPPNRTASSLTSGERP
jgi:hypothetical protein